MKTTRQISPDISKPISWFGTESFGTESINQSTGQSIVRSMGTVWCQLWACFCVGSALAFLGL